LFKNQTPVLNPSPVNMSARAKRYRIVFFHDRLLLLFLYDYTTKGCCLQVSPLKISSSSFILNKKYYLFVCENKRTLASICRHMQNYDGQFTIGFLEYSMQKTLESNEHIYWC
jgi:hypothetical protein